MCITNIPTNEIQIIKKDLNLKRKEKISYNNDFSISFNCWNFCKEEISIHTEDINTFYIPDFDFTFFKTKDHFKRKKKIQKKLLTFRNVDFIRSEYFFQKIFVCESLEYFKIIYEMLDDSGEFLITVPNFYEYSKLLLKTKKTNFKKINRIETTIFSNVDSTGLIYNKSIWNLERLKRSLINKTGFRKIKLNKKNRSKYCISLTAIK